MQLPGTLVATTGEELKGTVHLSNAMWIVPPLGSLKPDPARLRAITFVGKAEKPE